jgi:hypothetical protein
VVRRLPALIFDLKMTINFFLISTKFPIFQEEEFAHVSRETFCLKNNDLHDKIRDLNVFSCKSNINCCVRKKIRPFFFHAQYSLSLGGLFKHLTRPFQLNICLDWSPHTTLEAGTNGVFSPKQSVANFHTNFQIFFQLSQKKFLQNLKKKKKFSFFKFAN